MEEGAGAVGGEVEQFAIIETEQKKYQSLSFTGRPVMLIHCTRQRHRQSGSNVTWAVCNGSSQFAAAELVWHVWLMSECQNEWRKPSYNYVVITCI